MRGEAWLDAAGQRRVRGAQGVSSVEGRLERGNLGRTVKPFHREPLGTLLLKVPTKDNRLCRGRHDVERIHSG